MKQEIRSLKYQNLTKTKWHFGTYESWSNLCANDTSCQLATTTPQFLLLVLNYRVAQNKIPHQTICNIFETNGQILKILEAV